MVFSRFLWKLTGQFLTANSTCDSEQYLFRISDPDTKLFLNIKKCSFLNSESFSPKESESVSIAVCYNISTGYIWVLWFLVFYQWLRLFCSGLWIVEIIEEMLNWGSPDVWSKRGGEKEMKWCSWESLMETQIQNFGSEVDLFQRRHSRRDSYIPWSINIFIHTLSTVFFNTDILTFEK